jgi:hypothetical protein
MVQQHDDMLALMELERERNKELAKIAEAIDALVLSLNFQKANVVPTPTPPRDANTGPLRPRDTTPSAVNWRPFKTGTPGGWCYANENEPLRDTLLAAQKKTVLLENYTYRLSGDNDQFVQRFPVGPRK